MRIKQLALVVLCTALAVWGCQPEDEFGEAPINTQLNVKTTLLSGTWRLASVRQVDEELRRNGAPASDYINTPANLTTVNALGVTETATLQLVLNLNGEAPSTFTATGTAAGIVPASGTWAVNDPVFTSEVRLTGAGQTGASGTTTLLLSQQVTNQPTLSLRVDRMQGGVLQSYIVYNFTR